MGGSSRSVTVEARVSPRITVPLDCGVYVPVVPNLMTLGTSFPSPKPIKISYEDIEDELKF